MPHYLPYQTSLQEVLLESTGSEQKEEWKHRDLRTDVWGDNCRCLSKATRQLTKEIPRWWGRRHRPVQTNHGISWLILQNVGGMESWQGLPLIINQSPQHWKAAWPKRLNKHPQFTDCVYETICLLVMMVTYHIMKSLFFFEKRRLNFLFGHLIPLLFFCIF